MPIDRTVLFVKSAALDSTPGVPRIIARLRAARCVSKAVGVEHGYWVRIDPGCLDIDRLSTFRMGLGWAHQRLLGLVLWQVFQGAVLARSTADVVHFCDALCAVPCLLVKLARGTRLILDLRENAASAVIPRVPGAAAGLALLERLALAGSDVVIVGCEERLSSLPRGARTKTFVVANLPERDAFGGYRFAEDSLTVCLAGLVSERSSLAALVNAVAAREDVRLEVCGGVVDARAAQLLDACGIHGISSIDRAETLRRMADCDAVWVGSDPSVTGGRHAESAEYLDALMLGKPVLCAKGSVIADEVLDAKCGLAVGYGNTEALGRAIESLRLPRERVEMGQRARELFELKRSSAPATTIEEVYQQLEGVR